MPHSLWMRLLANNHRLFRSYAINVKSCVTAKDEGYGPCSKGPSRNDHVCAVADPHSRCFDRSALNAWIQHVKSSTIRVVQQRCADPAVCEIECLRYEMPSTSRYKCHFALAKNAFTHGMMVFYQAMMSWRCDITEASPLMPSFSVFRLCSLRIC